MRFLTVAVKSALGRFRARTRAGSIDHPSDRPATLGSELCTRYGKQRPADECVCCWKCTCGHTINSGKIKCVCENSASGSIGTWTDRPPTDHSSSFGARQNPLGRNSPAKCEKSTVLLLRWLQQLHGDREGGMPHRRTLEMSQQLIFWRINAFAEFLSRSNRFFPLRFLRDWTAAAWLRSIINAFVQNKRFKSRIIISPRLDVKFNRCFPQMKI